jgi:thymidylate synthase
MNSYLNMLRLVRDAGEIRPCRTGEQVRGLFDAQLHFDLQSGFPLEDTKFVPFKSIIGELVAFFRGATSAADFRQFGCNVWDANANGEVNEYGVRNAWLDNPHRAGIDDLGPLYGYQWRRQESIKMIDNKGPHEQRKIQAFLKDGYNIVGHMALSGYDRVFLRKEIDQLQELIDGIKKDPYGRRHLITTWNPGVLKEIALPACHGITTQFYVRDGKYLDVIMYQRSADMFLGVPFNIASYAAKTHVIAHLTGYLPGKLTIKLGDLHIYESHLPQVNEQLARTPGTELPTLELRPFTSIDDLTPEHFILHGYKPQGALKAKMSL